MATYDNNKVVAMRYHGNNDVILHLQQYSHRLDLFFSNFCMYFHSYSLYFSPVPVFLHCSSVSFGTNSIAGVLLVNVIFSALV